MGCAGGGPPCLRLVASLPRGPGVASLRHGPAVASLPHGPSYNKNSWNKKQLEQKLLEQKQLEQKKHAVLGPIADIILFFPQALLKGSQNHTGEHTCFRLGKFQISGLCGPNLLERVPGRTCLSACA